MNEYTRREEVRWTLIASLVLVLCMAPAVFLLVTAKGKLIPDPAARTAATAAADKAKAMKSCVSAAEKLATELDVFQASAKAAHLDADAPPAETAAAALKKPPRFVRGKPAPKEKEPDATLAWPAAQPVQKQTKILAPCRATIEDAAGARAESAAAWDAIAKVAEVADPGAESSAQITAARAVLKALSGAAVDKVQKQASDAEAALKKAAEAASQKADTATVREALPKGVLDRGLALGIGVGLSAITLILSYLSVRVASTRRMATLVPLREAARMGQPGAHAAAVLKLASHHNGGQPGMVIGAAVGGLVAAALARLDSDFFIVGVMAGCLVGLGFQWAFRIAVGASSWRTRASELADVEKPAIPIVLVLSGVNNGLEAPFIKFFNGLSDHDAAQTVEKLAAQAEERILAAADAGAAARQAQ